ncbi:glycerophosphodiester phosphodiesterase [Lederbergia graminis]
MSIISRLFITAHSGCMNTRQNSHASVLAGIREGADMMEVDIRATKDDHVVLYHDESIITSDGSKLLRELPYEALNDVILLENVLPYIKMNNRTINLDVKEDNAIAPMIRIIEHFDMQNQVLITGCEKERAAFIKAHYPTYKVLLNASFALFETCDYSSYVQQTIADAIDSKSDGINIHYQHCREELLESAKANRLPVYVWTVDQPTDMVKFMQLGVQSITTNNVKTLVHLRNEYTHISK